jgi:lysophospholipase L1-like esterase
VARAVAADSRGRADVLDASEVWGPTYRQVRDGLPDRNPDGVHTCPQGAARFAAWLLDELAERFDAITPAPARDWAAGAWAGEDHFRAC